MLSFARYDRFLCNLPLPMWNPKSFLWATTWSQPLREWLRGWRGLNRNQCISLSCNTAIRRRWSQSKGDGSLVPGWLRCSRFLIIHNFLSCIFVFPLVLCIYLIPQRMGSRTQTLPPRLECTCTRLWSIHLCIHNSRMRRSSRLSTVRLGSHFCFIESYKRFLWCLSKWMSNMHHNLAETLRMTFSLLLSSLCPLLLKL